jgi:hypothetical protein
MARKPAGNENSPLQILQPASPGAARPLQVLFVYEDAQTRAWGAEVGRWLEKQPGWQTLQSTWWKMADLEQPGVLAGAVSKAMRADLIIVAACGAEALPLPFYIWVNSWLPHRPPGSGTLVGLLALAQRGYPHAGRLRKYLRTVARQARMACLLDERRVWFATGKTVGASN